MKKPFLKAVSLLVCVLFVFQTTAFAAEEILFYHTDPVGTPLAMSNMSGQKVWEADYKPFGEEFSAGGSKGNSKRFVGKEKDSETGLNYFGARYLSGPSGRFLAPDPVRAVNPLNGEIYEKVLLIPQRINVYAYALSSPCRYVDRDGNDEEFWDGYSLGVRPGGMVGGGGGGLGNLNPNGSLGASAQGARLQANSINGREALRSKLSGLEKAQSTAVKIENLPDGRVRYYTKEVPARSEGPTRGASFVTESEPTTGKVRQWMESYDKSGKVIRVHPKSINGQIVNSQHYPPTAKELNK